MKKLSSLSLRFTLILPVVITLLIIGSAIAVFGFVHKANDSTLGSSGTHGSSLGIYASYGTTIYKFDLRSGATLWQHNTGDSMHVLSVAPVVVGNSVYISSGNALYALDARTGMEEWHHQWGLSLSGSNATPIIIGNIVALAATDGLLHIIDATSGKELWNKSISNGDTILPTTGASSNNDLLFITSSNSDGKILYAFHLQNGSEAWNTAMITTADDPSSFRLTMEIVTPNAIYGSYSRYNGGGFLRAFARDNGKHLWNTPLEQGVEISHLIFHNDALYLTADAIDRQNSNAAEAYNAKNGALLWRFPVGATVTDTPVLDKENIIFSTLNGNVYALDAKSGMIRWSHHIQGGLGLMTMSNGITYVEVGDINPRGEGPLSIIPRYILALSKDGSEQQRYNIEQGVYTLLVASPQTLYLVDDTANLFAAYHDLFALQTKDAAQLWHAQIKNFPSSGLFATVQVS